LLLLLYAVLDAIGDKQIIGNCADCMETLKGSNQAYYQFLQMPLTNIVLARVLSGGLLYQLLFQLGLPVAIKTGRNYYRQAVQQLQLAKDNLQLEFNFLKAQVNPHFLFNTLNNLYSLVVSERNKQAAATIARLSGFMRYTLYETGAEKVLLSKEVAMLKDYTELEKLRLNETEVTFEYEQDRDNYKMPPLLLMPALENAFKYSVDNLPQSHISINMLAANNTLQVTIENNFDPQRQTGGGGIGLQNLQRRLQHYYPGSHSYTATAKDGLYIFKLHCTLQ
jgi:sensor histidine kinase YesM